MCRCRTSKLSSFCPVVASVFRTSKCDADQCQRHCRCGDIASHFEIFRPLILDLILDSPCTFALTTHHRVASRDGSKPAQDADDGGRRSKYERQRLLEFDLFFWRFLTWAQHRSFVRHSVGDKECNPTMTPPSAQRRQEVVDDFYFRDDSRFTIHIRDDKTRLVPFRLSCFFFVFVPHADH